MGVPKKRKSKAAKLQRRAHDGLTVPTAVDCSQCGEKMRPHHVCPACGYYKGKQVREIEEF